jgi:tetratricopeptide (TPR) repeat protein
MRIGLHVLAAATVIIAPFSVQAQQRVVYNQNAEVEQLHNTFLRMYKTQDFVKMMDLLDYFERIAGHSNNANTLYLLGSDLADAREWERALPILNRALALSPNNRNILNSIGNAYYYAGQNDMAMEYYGRAKALGNTVASGNVSLLQRQQAAAAAAEAARRRRPTADEIQRGNLARCGDVRYHIC